MYLLYKGRVQSSGNGYNLGVSGIPIHGKCSRRQSMHTSTRPRTRLSSLLAFFNHRFSPRIGIYISVVGDTQLTILSGLTTCHMEHLVMWQLMNLLYVLRFEHLFLLITLFPARFRFCWAAVQPRRQAGQMVVKCH